MKPYKHIVQYYETDRMGVTHHSNYIRWMEEARVSFLAAIGWNYEKMEAMGIISPVTAIQCRYMKTSTFADEVYVTVTVQEFRGIKLKLAYTMENHAGEKLFSATSEHCFLSENQKPIRVDKEFPEFFNAVQQFVEKD
ncbi:MAG: acyl-CoA thioesterase [Eubacterium sp.]|nr:acyl-CoA thioesterase [Eubacterium sp.]